MIRYTLVFLSLFMVISIKKDCNPYGVENTIRPQSVFAVLCMFHLTMFDRHSKKYQVYAGLLTQTSTLYLPSQTSHPVVFIGKTPSIQWRDRAGIAPASILASYPTARKDYHSAKHRE